MICQNFCSDCIINQVRIAITKSCMGIANEIIEKEIENNRINLFEVLNTGDKANGR